MSKHEISKNKTHIFTPNALEPFGTYSQAVKVGDLLFVSGQLPIKKGDTDVVSDDPVEQLYQCFDNLKNICKAANSSLSQAVKINIYYTDIEVSNNLNTVMEDLFTEPYPARIRVQVAGLSKNAKVEIDGVFTCHN